VLVDPEQLQAKGVRLDQVIGPRECPVEVPLTFLEALLARHRQFPLIRNQRLRLWHVLPISSAEDLAQVPVDGAKGCSWATWRRSWRITRCDRRCDHRRSPNLQQVIEKLPEINTLEVTRGIESALAALEPGLPGLKFDSSLFRPATFIEQAITNLTQTFVIAVLLMVLVLGIFLYGWRTALISLLAIIVSMFAALFVLYLRGATLNAMVLAGLVIALGIVIDDAVVDIEHIMLHLRKTRAKPCQTLPGHYPGGARRGCGNDLLRDDDHSPGGLPVFFLEGMTGALFGPLALSYALAVIAAMVAALTLTPALSLLLLSGAGIQFRESPLIPRLQRGYERLLARMVNSHAPVNIALVVLIVAGLVVVPFLRRDPLLPSFREPYLTIQIKASPATSLPEMNRIVARMSDELRSVPGFEIGAHVGRAVFGDQVVGINSAELWVGIAEGADYDATVTAIQDTAVGYPGLAPKVETYLQQRLSQPEHMVPSEDITLRVYGEEFTALRAEAEKLEQSLRGIEGISESRVILPILEPTVEIEVDLAAAQKYGVKPGEVRRTAAALLSGILVGSLFEQQKVFDVLVWGAPEIRRNLSDIQDLMIRYRPAGWCAWVMWPTLTLWLPRRSSSVRPFPVSGCGFQRERAQRQTLPLRSGRSCRNQLPAGDTTPRVAMMRTGATDGPGRMMSLDWSSWSVCSCFCRRPPGAGAWRLPPS
jgi:Cu/Ag efflux pump CusA